MSNNILKYFVTDGVYKLNNSNDEFIFVCETSNINTGKLIQYKNVGGVYERTDLCYFLHTYKEDDIKSLFLNRENYEILGMLGQNFVMSKDRKQVLKG